MQVERLQTGLLFSCSIVHFPAAAPPVLEQQRQLASQPEVEVSEVGGEGGGAGEPHDHPHRREQQHLGEGRRKDRRGTGSATSIAGNELPAIHDATRMHLLPGARMQMPGAAKKCKDF